MARQPRAIDLNRVLPELPIKQLSDTKCQSSPSMHQISSAPRSKAGCFPQSSPSASSKKHLQAVTQRLLTQATPEDVRYFQEDFDPVEPIKFSPLGDSNMHTAMTPANLYNELDQSPYQEERFTRIDDLLREYEKANAQTAPTAPRLQPTRYQHKPKGMSHSISENNIAFRRDDGQHQFLPNLPQRIDHYDAGTPSNTHASEASSFARARGRVPLRPLSPSKGLEDIEEDQAPESTRNESLHQIPPVDPPTSPTKRSRSPMKQLFGEKGFLGRSTSMKELPSEEYRKRGVKHLGEKLKHRVEGMTEGVSKFMPTSISHGDLSKLIPASLSNRESPSKSGSAKVASTFPVSLTPPEQAKFYSEAELMIVATANNYLIIQKEEGRMSYESVAKITNFWAQKNRPQVIEFMFDQLTQRDLILHNLKTFRFYGPNAENAMSMNAMMNSWKTLAKEMSVRTFCTGDSTIRKQIQDIYKILELLGAPMVTFMAFQQIQVRILKIMREKQKERDEHEAIKFGVERKWEPPGGFGPRGSAESEAYTNPFANDSKA
ncbi:MAG: hypothetical protein LQ338_005818 [Usnochroma carphineum]|nr:MAG: hypothetical protein LQ338_005818 [Usnochroma carphineum]